MPTPARRRFISHAALAAGAVAVGAPARAAAEPSAASGPAATPALLRAPRLRPGDTLALISPSGATFENAPVEIAVESLQALGFKVRQAPHLRSRYGSLGGTDAERAADVNALFADPGVQGLLALGGGNGGNRILPLIDYEAIRRNPKFLGGYSDLTALINAVHRKTGLVTFHCPMGASEWNAFSVHWWRAAVMDAQMPTLRNEIEPEDALVPANNRITTLRGGRASGPLVGGNLSVLSALAGSAYWPQFDGAVLMIEEINEYLYRVDRMLSTLKLAGALDRLAGVVLGGFTNCTPGEGYGALTLDEILGDWFKPLNVPVFAGAEFGHIKRKFTLPVGLPVEIDADAGTLRYLEPAVT